MILRILLTFLLSAASCRPYDNVFRPEAGLEQQFRTDSSECESAALAAPGIFSRFRMRGRFIRCMELKGYTREMGSRRADQISSYRDPRADELTAYMKCIDAGIAAVKEQRATSVGECKRPREMRPDETLKEYIDRVRDEQQREVCIESAYRSGVTPAQRHSLRSQCDQTFEMTRLRRAAERKP